MYRLNTYQMTILYDIIREGTYKVDMTSAYGRDRLRNVNELIGIDFLKVLPSKGYQERFGITRKGRKHIKDYEKGLKIEMDAVDRDSAEMARKLNW